MGEKVTFHYQCTVLHTHTECQHTTWKAHHTCTGTHHWLELVLGLLVVSWSSSSTSSIASSSGTVIIVHISQSDDRGLCNSYVYKFTTYWLTRSSATYPKTHYTTKGWNNQCAYTTYYILSIHAQYTYIRVPCCGLG